MIGLGIRFGVADVIAAYHHIEELGEVESLGDALDGRGGCGGDQANRQPSV